MAGDGFQFLSPGAILSQLHAAGRVGDGTVYAVCAAYYGAYPGGGGGECGRVGVRADYRRLCSEFVERVEGSWEQRGFSGVEYLGGVGGDAVECETQSGGVSGRGDREGTGGSCAAGGVSATVDSKEAVAVGSVEVGRVLVGPNGGKSSGRKENYWRNQASRDRKRERKRESAGLPDRRSVVVGLEEKTDLQKSLEAKWQVENELAKLRAEQQLELLRARDLERVKKMQSAQVLRTTEKCKVDTERAFGFLARTGNVSGFAETVVSSEGTAPGLSSGSRSTGTCISPDSSVSQQEIRQMQKDLLDAQRMIDRLRVQCPREVEHVELNLGVKTAFTLNSDGSVPIEEDGCMGSDGKFHTENYVKDPTYVMTSRQLQLLRDAGCEEF
jgi:hypothetical protein